MDETVDKKSTEIPANKIYKMNENTPKISPKKRRLEIPEIMEKTKINNNRSRSKGEQNKKFKYGNYDRYYGYRNTNDFKDVRLDALKQHRHLFDGKEILDIGCNNGMVTTALAKDFGVKQITGLDIDRKLISSAIHRLKIEKKNSFDLISSHQYPNNVIFKHGNYVLPDPKLLELDAQQFDTIVCLSLTKWIHLNHGDSGLKLAFQRMFRQLRPGGHLILETQNWQSYKRRKKLTPEIFENFKQIKLFPNQFDDYLLGADVGFNSFYLVDLPKHESAGFQRPIKVFVTPDGKK